MKKSIIYLGVALLAIGNVSYASNTILNGPIPKVVINEDTTPLCNAIIKGDVETVKKFIAYGADVNQTSNGLTPLMMAARYNRLEIAKILVENGADVKAKDDKGYTALKYAELSKAESTLNYLKEV